MGIEAIFSVLSSVAGLASGIMGGGGKAPSVSPQAADNTDAEKKKAKVARSALLSTEGGVSGSELQGGQVQSNRQTLLGN